MGGTPTLVQDHFRIRSDTETAAGGTPTWVAAEDTNVNYTVDTTIRCRFVVSNTGTASSASGIWICRYSYNGGAYTAITTADTKVQLTSSASPNTGATTITPSNFVLTAGSGTAISGGYTDDTDSPNFGSLSSGRYTEFEFGFSLLSAGGVTAGDTIDLRVYNSTSPLNTYSVTPRITIPVPAGVGSASGDATASGIFTAAAAFYGTAQGDAAASAVGSSTAQTVGSAQGDATVSGQATAAAVMVGSASGDATADAVGATGVGIITGDGDASGDAAASAEGASAFTATGTAEGDAAAAAVGNGDISTDGLAQGDAEASAEGFSLSSGDSQGFAQGDSDASAFSAGDEFADGEAIGDSDALGDGNADVPADGLAQGDAIASGVGNGITFLVGTAIGDSTADAIAGGSIGSATGDSTAAAFSIKEIAADGFAEGDSVALAIAEGGAVGLAEGDSIASAVGFSTTGFHGRGVIAHSTTRLSSARSRSSAKGSGTAISKVA